MKKVTFILLILVSLATFSQPTNLDFETGNITGWSFEDAVNLNSLTMANNGFSPSTNYSVITPNSPEILNIPINMNSPFGGNFLRMGNSSTGGNNLKRLKQTFGITNTAHALSVAYSVVFEGALHDCHESSYFYVTILDENGDRIPNTFKHFIPPDNSCSNEPNTFLTSTQYKYTNWEINSFDLSAYIGTNVTLEVYVAGCALSGHLGYGYFDAVLCANSFSPNFLTINNHQYNLISPQNYLTVCNTATANVVASAGAFGYSWFGPGISGLSSQSVSITQPGIYNLIMDKPSACSNTTSVTFTVGGTSPIISVVGPTLVCSQSNVSLTASGAAYYNWYPLPQSLYSNTSEGIYQPTSNATYTIIGFGSDGCSSSTTHSLVVAASPTVNITRSNPVCGVQTTTLTASGADVYRWNNGNTTPIIIVTPTVTTYYLLSGTLTSTGCVKSSSITINVYSVTVNSSSTGICPGQTATLSASGGSTYTWTPGNLTGNSIVVSPTVSTSYFLAASDAYGCSHNKNLNINVSSSNVSFSTYPDPVCSGAPASISVFGLNSYTWQPGSIVSNSISVIANAASIYTVEGTFAMGCLTTKTISLNVAPIPTITVNSGTICPGNSFSITPSGANTYTIEGGNYIVSPISNTSYTVIGESAEGCLSANTATCEVILDTSPGIAVNNGTICSGESFTITPSGAITYTIEGGADVVTPLTSSTYSIQGQGLNGCESFTVSSVHVNQTPALITTPSNSVCQGSSVILQVSGANTYSWSNGANTATTSVMPTTNTIYSVTGTDNNNCSSTETISVSIDNTCQDVWPGDANSDGIANNLDILELGFHFNRTGAQRSIISNTWQSYFSNNWVGAIINGKNLNHSDCNGDGIINSNDTLAIYNNYGLIHTFKPNENSSTNVQLKIVPDQNSVVKGSWGSASIYLGDSASLTGFIRGVAFTINFDNQLIEPNQVYLEYVNSFIEGGQNLKFRKTDFMNGKLYTATTNVIGFYMGGHGLIAKLHYQIKSTLANDETLTIGILDSYKSTDTEITTLTSGSCTVQALASDVGVQEFNSNVVFVSPNPTIGDLIINSKFQLQKIEIVTITGQLLLTETPTHAIHKINLEDFTNGIYFINVYQNNQVIKREKVVLTK